MRSLTRLFVVPALFMSWLTGIGPALATPITVTRLDDPPQDGCGSNGCSLREAISQANAAPDANVIALPAGTYTLALTGSAENANANGDLDILEPVAITGATAATTVIDASAIAQRVFDVANVVGTSLTMSGVTVRGGAESGMTGGSGILVRASSSSLTLTDSVVTANHAPGGGTGGGGILTSGTATLARVTLAGNTASGLGSYGGGLFSSGTTTMTASTIAGNAAGTSGGGVVVSAGTTSLTNVTLSGNTAGTNGGAVFITGGTVNLQSGTVTANHADANGGGLAQSGIAALKLLNSVVGGNTASAGPSCSGTVSSQGHNVVQSTSGCGFASTTGDITGQDPKLGALGDNGGPTQTHALLDGSPAIDAGAGCPDADQRGAPRAGACDVGAYELVLCRKVAVNRIGTEGNDRLTGTGGADGLLGQGGKDKLSGKGGKDGLCGGPGKDALKGGGGKDSLDGGPGKDTCIGQGGTDKSKGCEKEKSIP